MTSITIALNDEQTERLQRFVEEHGQTLEQAARSLLAQALPEMSPEALPDASPHSPFASTLDLAGIINDSSIAPLIAREIDAILADEALHSHNEPGEHGGE